MPERITKQLLCVLDVLMADPSREWYGLEFMEITGLSSGTLYPILHRLVRDGWLVRTREVPSETGGTGRRLYRLTGTGARCATELLASRKVSNRRAVPRLQPGVQPA